ncbi:MAG TPA: potassium channel protein [Polyangia bacterium]|nr:potassium channel protein [Polyangia bacterium]
MGPDSSRLLRERILVASIALFAIFLVGTFGFYAMGRLYLGRYAWDLGECAYMTVITITTVGFGELPHLARVPGGRAFTVGVLLAGLGVAAYFVSALTTYFIEGEFTKARTRRRMTRALDQIRDHIIVCGVGTTGVHVVEELVWTKWPLVAIDRDPQRLEKLQELSVTMLPTVVGDATEDEVLERAGIRHARGIVAALTDDKDNLFIVVSARQLNPQLRIIAKGVDMAASEKLKRAGADSVVNPAFIGGVRMVSEMIRPQVVEFLDLMLRDKDKNLRIEEVMVPKGSPLVGKPIFEAEIRKNTNLLVVAVREPPEATAQPGRFIYNPGPETRIVADMALIVLGETESVHKLRRSIARGFDAPTA